MHHLSAVVHQCKGNGMEAGFRIPSPGLLSLGPISEEHLSLQINAALLAEFPKTAVRIAVSGKSYRLGEGALSLPLEGLPSRRPRAGVSAPLLRVLTMPASQRRKLRLQKKHHLDPKLRQSELSSCLEPCIPQVPECISPPSVSIPSLQGKM